MKAEILALMSAILDSGIIEKGPYVRQLAAAFQAMCGAPHPGVPCDSGTDALKIALEALGIGPGDEVIVPELSFMSTVSAVHELGATPVFADILPDGSYTLDPQAAEAALTGRTAAIIPVHLFGLPVDAQAFVRLQERYGLPIIGDAAQAHGAEYCGKRVGNLGFTFEVFSLAAVKNVGGWRFGGIVLHRDPEIAPTLQQLVDLGRSPGESYLHSRHGFRANMDEMNAGIILLQLPHLDEWNAAREQIAARYDEALMPFAPAIQPPTRFVDRRSAWWQYAIGCQTPQLRDRLHRYLRSYGVESVHYPCILSEQPAIQRGRRPYRVTSNEQAKDAVARQLLLPIYPELIPEQQEYVLTCIRSFFEQGYHRSPLLDA